MGGGVTLLPHMRTCCGDQSQGWYRFARAADALGPVITDQERGKEFLKLQTTTVFADQNKKGLLSKMSRKPFIYMWCPEPGSNRHVQRTRDFKSVNLSFINIWLAIILRHMTR